MLLDDIIDMLADDARPLAGVLLKAKVLIHQLGAPELAIWLSGELNGYQDADAVPSYRVIPGLAKADIAGIGGRRATIPIPTGHVSDDMRAMLESVELRQPVATLETLVAKGAGQALTTSVPMEWNEVLEEGLSEDYVIQTAWVEINKANVVGVLSSKVRSRLLDFLLDLRGLMGNPSTETAIVEAAKSLPIREVFAGAIFGNNTTIILDSHNSLQVITQVMRGDDAGLAEAMRRAGLSDAEIQELQKAVTQDRQTGTANFDGKVGHWYFELLKKAGKRAVSVGTEVVSGVVTKLLQQYLGLLG